MHANIPGANDRDPVFDQAGGERSILEGAERLEAPHVPVGRRGDPDRRTGEMVMTGVGLQTPDAQQPLGGVALSPRKHGRRKQVALGRVELDQSGDGPGAAKGVGELALQPIVGRPGISVGAGDQAIRAAVGEQPRRRRLHARPSRSTRSRPRALKRAQPQPELPCGHPHHFGGPVAAGIQDDDRLERRDAHGLLRQRAQARADRVLLVLRRHHHHGAHFHSAPSLISSRPCS